MDFTEPGSGPMLYGILSCELNRGNGLVSPRVMGTNWIERDQAGSLHHCTKTDLKQNVAFVIYLNWSNRLIIWKCGEKSKVSVQLTGWMKGVIWMHRDRSPVFFLETTALGFKALACTLFSCM